MMAPASILCPTLFAYLTGDNGSECGRMSDAASFAASFDRACFGLARRRFPPSPGPELAREPDDRNASLRLCGLTGGLA